MLRMVRVVLAILLFTVAILGTSKIANADATFSTTWNTYPLGEPVGFSLSVLQPPAVILPSWDPYEVLTGTNHVFAPKTSRGRRVVGPAATANWLWFQVDNYGNRVRPGEYSVVLYTMGAKIFDAKFKIVNTGPDALKERLKDISRWLGAGGPIIFAIGLSTGNWPVAVVGVVGTAAAVVFKDLAEDPADPDYRQPVELRERTFETPLFETGLDRAAWHLNVSLLGSSDVMDAMRRALEKTKGALEQGDITYANKLRNQVKTFASIALKQNKALLSSIETFTKRVEEKHWEPPPRYLVDKYTEEQPSSEMIKYVKALGMTEAELFKAVVVLKEYAKRRKGETPTIPRVLREIQTIVQIQTYSLNLLFDQGK